MHTSTTSNYTEQISTLHGLLLASKALAFWHITRWQYIEDNKHFRPETF